MKKCSQCGIKKDLSEFYIHPQMGDGYLSRCKDCTKDNVRKNYEKNKTNPEWHQKEKNRCQQKYPVEL